MNTRRSVLACLTLALFAGGCISPSSDEKFLTEQQALDAAWQALEPYTSSHDQANWQTVAVRLVEGQEVASQFEGQPAPGCIGPTPPPNKQISTSSTYWYVVLRPAPATPLPKPGTPSPTAPPLIPEPFVSQALFLLDTTEGTVVARKLSCVIY